MTFTSQQLKLISQGRCPIHSDVLVSATDWVNVKGGEYDGGKQKVMRCPRAGCVERAFWTMNMGRGRARTTERDLSPFKRIE